MSDEDGTARIALATAFDGMDVNLEMLEAARREGGLSRALGSVRIALPSAVARRRHLGRTAFPMPANATVGTVADRFRIAFLGAELDGKAHSEFALGESRLSEHLPGGCVTASFAGFSALSKALKSAKLVNRQDALLLGLVFGAGRKDGDDLRGFDTQFDGSGGLIVNGARFR